MNHKELVEEMRSRRFKSWDELEEKKPLKESSKPKENYKIIEDNTTDFNEKRFGEWMKQHIPQGYSVGTIGAYYEGIGVYRKTGIFKSKVLLKVSFADRELVSLAAYNKEGVELAKKLAQSNCPWKIEIRKVGC